MCFWKKEGAVRIENVVLNFFHGTCLLVHSLRPCFIVGWLLSPSLSPCPLIKQNTCMFWEVLATHPGHCHPGSVGICWKSPKAGTLEQLWPLWIMCSGLCTSPRQMWVWAKGSEDSCWKRSELQSPQQMLKPFPPSPRPLTKTPWLFLPSLSLFFHL